jgi:hypothetical protein
MQRVVVDPVTLSPSEQDQGLAVRWGVLPGPWLWSPKPRILVVLDGRIDTSDNPRAFGLAFALDTLLDKSVAPWVRFDVDIARRDLGKNQLHAESNKYPYKYLNFRFTQEGFKLGDYDQVWFFGDFPMNTPDDPNDAKYSPLGSDELKLLAEWMDRGGGVFAAGDHYDLGASMCSRIPRVRTMRRWTVGQGVPSQFGNDRHETLQHIAGGFEDVWEDDTTPQPVEPVYQVRTTSILARPMVPHPLLCAPGGAVVDKFPDHMHEGDVIDDDEVDLDSPLGIPGYERDEYPFDEPVATAGGVAAAVAPEVEDPRPRPRPHVVAYGRTTNPAIDTAPPPLPNRLARVSPVRTTKRFGLVSAYDGDRVGIGRVVVDSTWHHWFSYNLHGFRANNLPVYELMQAYYRNVGLWLTGPAQRQSMLVAATWATVASDPMAFPVASGESLWAIGKRVVNIIGRTASQCTLFEFVSSFFSGRAEEIFNVPDDVDPSDPYSARVQADLAVRAIVGGIAASLLKPASDYHQAGGSQRRLLNPDAIARHAADGVKQGHLALVAAAQSSASEKAVRNLKATFRPPPLIRIPVALVPMRVVAERLQLPDPTDPALADDLLTITIRLSLAGSVIACEVIDGIDTPSFESRGAYIDLNRVLYEGLAQSGEALVVELLTGAAERHERVASERLRFTETVKDEPATWIGPHIPSRNQTWRLWYRIEQTDHPATVPADD